MPDSTFDNKLPASEKSAPKVCVVTVTYGDRWSFLSRVVNSLDEMPGIGRIVVVDNGATYDLRGKLDSLCGSRAAVAGRGRNEGSARGFALGLQAAHDMANTEYIWILDDDNCPAPNALEELMRNYQELSSTHPREKLALLSLRTDRQYLMQIADGADPRKVFARRGSFLDFHILDIPKLMIQKLHRRRIESISHAGSCVRIPFGVYGGLFFHHRLLDFVGYPDESFYLYGDDTEFTARIDREGDLFLVPSSLIHDLDKSWQVADAEDSGGRLSSLMNAPDFRVYYATRNGVLLSSMMKQNDSLVWHANKVVYMTLLKWYLRSKGRSDRFRLIHKAVAHGCHGRTGMVEEFQA